MVYTVYTLINATFSKSKIRKKSKKKESKNNDHGKNYVSPKQTCIQVLVRIDQ